MKRLRLVWALCLLCLPAIAPARQSSQQSDLKAIYTQKRFFDLRDALAKCDPKTTPDYSLYSGIVGNKFNRLDASIAQIRDYVDRWKPGVNLESLSYAYDALAEGYLKAFQYHRAADTYRQLLERCRTVLTPTQVEDIDRWIAVCGLMKDTPPQTVAFQGETKLRTVKDKIGLTRVPVRIAGSNLSFVFDTGAGLSCIIRTLANRLHLSVSTETVRIASGTGVTMNVNMAVCPAIQIGNATARNVVFFVLADADLSFPQEGYSIEGIIGFPVISALKEVVFTKGGELTIPAKPSTQAEQNLCLDVLTPIVTGTYRGKPMDFTFDTGATTSILNAPFVRTYEKEIKERAALESERIGSAGGSRAFASYKLKEIRLTVGQKEVVLRDIYALKDEADDHSSYFYGNLGQDMISQFSRMTINFDTMFVRFE